MKSIKNACFLFFIFITGCKTPLNTTISRPPYQGEDSIAGSYIRKDNWMSGVPGYKSYAKYPTEEHPEIKIDARLLGTWKAVEDTDSKNSMVVQSFHDVYHSSTVSSVDTTRKDCNYYITYFNRHGRNPLFLEWTAFLSEIDNTSFLDIKFMDVGFTIIRLIKINSACDTITTALIADTTLKDLKSSKLLCHRIASHLNNPSFYCDTMHFYKVNNVHYSIEEARDKAN